MKNRILAIVLVAGCLVSTLANSLGLGDIEVYSALNQPLAAEIELSSVRPGETDNMRVKLAGEDAFMQAGVERPFYLTRLKFNLAVKPDGTQYINITTEAPVREPFLNFLVDVDWPRGRLVREYTVLLDPPVFAGAQTAAPAQTEAGPVTGSASATGTPALIERGATPPVADEFAFKDESGTTEEELAADEDFAFDEAGAETPEQPTEFEQAQEGFETFDETGLDHEEEGFGVSETAERADLSAGLPDIQVSMDEGETAAEAGSAEEGEFEAFPDFEEPLETTSTEDLAFEETGAEEAEAYPYDEAETFEDTGPAEDTYEYLDETSPTDLSEPADMTTGFDDSMIASLPDISLYYDSSLPYDEAATNALLAQFAAEDAARARGVEATTETEHLVASGDTMYDIASRYKAPDVTVDQAMLSILRYNPDAFIKDNINSVKKGFVLRIPDRESMLRIDSADAMAEVRRQYALWREYRDQLAGAPSTVREAQTADNLYIAESDTGRQAAGRGDLSILAPGRDADASERASGAQQGSESGSSLYVDLQLAREQLQAERLEKEELQARLTDLTGQIETMDRLISLKDEQLARLQQRLAELGDQTTGLQQPEELAEETREPSEESVSAGETLENEATDETTTRPGLTLQAESDTGAEPAEEEPVFGETVTEGLEGAPVEEESGTEQLAASGDTEEQADRFESDFDTDFESQLDIDQPLELQTRGETTVDKETEDVTEPPLEGESSGVDEEEVSTVEGKPAVSERARPEGLAGWIYDHLPPSPWSLMIVDFLQSKINLPIVGPVSIPLLSGVVALLVVLLIVLVKPKRRSTKGPSVAGEASIDEEIPEDVHLTVEPAKAGFGERISAMFAPITSIFGGGKKSSIAAIAAQGEQVTTPLRGINATDYAEDDREPASVVDDRSEIESFDDTAKTAAEQAATTTGTFGATEKALSPAPTAAAKSVSAPEETSDDTTQEADVYLAYGLNDQAEELLSQALAIHPNKVEYKGKLLETYFAASKKNEFETLAADLHSGLGGRSSRVWDKAVAMGKEIAPDNPLFSDVADSGLKVSDFAPAKPETADLDLSEPQGSTTPDIAFDEEGGPASTTTDFDLDLGESEDDDGDATLLVSPGGRDRTEMMSAVEMDDEAEVPHSGDTDLQFDLEADADDEMASDLNIDFNADELGLDTEIDADTSGYEAAEAQTDDDATVAMEMSFNLDDESAGALDDETIGLDDSDADEISLDGMDSGEDLFEVDSNAGDDLIADLEEASVDTEFEIPDDDDTIIDADLDDDTISGDVGDEVSTKLDLAKAYMDMGDYDGASSTLEEVIAEGDNSQRQEAKELLDQIH